MKRNLSEKLRSALAVCILAFSLSLLTACSETNPAANNAAAVTMTTEQTPEQITEQSTEQTTEVILTTEVTSQAELTQPESAAEAVTGTETLTATEAVTTIEQPAENTTEQPAETIKEQTTETTTAQPAESATEQPTEATTAQTANASEPFIAEIQILLEEIPEYTGNPYIELNNNVPLFLDKELTTNSYEYYSDLDSLGRCGMACACIGQELMPTEERGTIGQIKPSGWHTVKYDIVDGNYLYNRCHLIGYQLTAENANEKNLITGTRHLNVQAMLPFENMVADYVKETENHVMYKVIPLYDGDSLVASGVVMMAKSVEDNGDGISFCVYCYNVQPGVNIDYATGESRLEEVPDQEETTTEIVATAEASATTEAPAATEAPTTTEAITTTEAPTQQATEAPALTYVANTNTKKFHYPTCSSVKTIKDENRWDFYGSRDELINMNYVPCKRCNP